MLSERGVVLGDGLGALRDGVLGELTRKEKANGSLDLPGGDGLPVVVAGKTDGLGGELLEDIGNERVHDGHGLAKSKGQGKVTDRKSRGEAPGASRPRDLSIVA